jgi:hypothetical protein
MIHCVAWEVAFTDEFKQWWDRLDRTQRMSISSSVELIEEYGPELGFPHTTCIVGSRHSHLRELRVQTKGSPIRILYAFDPRRTAILLIGGDKTGDDRWYRRFVPIAEKLYDEHLEILKREGYSHG